MCATCLTSPVSNASRPTSTNKFVGKHHPKLPMPASQPTRPSSSKQPVGSASPRVSASCLSSPLALFQVPQAPPPPTNLCKISPQICDAGLTFHIPDHLQPTCWSASPGCWPHGALQAAALAPPPAPRQLPPRPAPRRRSPHPAGPPHLPCAATCMAQRPSEQACTYTAACWLTAMRVRGTNTAGQCAGLHARTLHGAQHAQQGLHAAPSPSKPCKRQGACKSAPDSIRPVAAFTVVRCVLLLDVLPLAVCSTPHQRPASGPRRSPVHPGPVKDASAHTVQLSFMQPDFQRFEWDINELKP